MTEIEAHKNVHQRLAAAMQEVDYIQKEKKQGMNYTIVSHDAVTAKVRPVLLKNGIVYYPVRCDHSHDGNRAECSMTVRFVNIDEPQDFFDVPSFGYGIDTQDKGPGKAMSYAVKYALLKALGLETGDDPDTDNIEHVSQDDENQKRYVELTNSLLTEMSYLSNERGLMTFWNDNKQTIQDMKPDVRKKFVDKKDELKAKFAPKKDVVDDIQDAFPGSKVVSERVQNPMEAY